MRLKVRLSRGIPVRRPRIVEGNIRERTGMDIQHTRAVTLRSGIQKAKGRRRCKRDSDNACVFIKTISIA